MTFRSFSLGEFERIMMFYGKKRKMLKKIFWQKQRWRKSIPGVPNNRTYIHYIYLYIILKGLFWNVYRNASDSNGWK